MNDWEYRERYHALHREPVLLKGQEDLQNLTTTDSAFGFYLLRRFIMNQNSCSDMQGFFFFLMSNSSLDHKSSIIFLITMPFRKLQSSETIQIDLVTGVVG